MQLLNEGKAEMVGRGACGGVSHWWEMAGAVRLWAYLPWSCAPDLTWSRAHRGQRIMVGETRTPGHQGLTQHDLTAQGSLQAHGGWNGLVCSSWDIIENLSSYL